MNFNLSVDTSAPLALSPDPSPRRQLLTPLPEPGHFLMVIDNSSCEKFVTCPQSAYNYLVLGREPHAKNAALVFGGALHCGLEALLVGKSEDEQNQAVLSFFAHHPAPPDEYRTESNCLEVLRHYRQRATFPAYEWQLQSDDRGPLVERAFELPLGVVDVNDYILMPWLSSGDNDGKGIFVDKIHIAWSGRMDAIANVNGLCRVVDHKTTSIAGDQVIQDFQLSNQTIGYVWAARQLWPDLDVRGFCVNFVHLKKPVKGCGLMDKGPRGGDPALNFFRAFFQYSDERLSWWQNNALDIVSDFIHCLARNSFPSHTKWCFGKYGKCPYHDVCCQDNAAVRSNMLRSDMFKDVTWNPTANR
jgi:hypothetical protein